MTENELESKAPVDGEVRPGLVAEDPRLQEQPNQEQPNEGQHSGAAEIFATGDPGPDVEQAADEPAGQGEIQAIFERIVADLTAQEDAMRSERLDAERLLGVLLAQPHGRRQLLCRNSRRFMSWSLCQGLIRKSHEVGFQDPLESRRLAELATEVAERVDRQRYGDGPVEDLRAAAWAQLGNARRICSDLKSADEAFAIAEVCLDRGTGDPLELGRFLDLLASLRRAQRQFGDSKHCLDRAIALYREVDDVQLEGRALLKKAMVHGAEGDPRGGISLLYQALEHIDPAEEPRLALSAQMNLAWFLNDDDKPLEAQAALGRARRLRLKCGDEMDLLRLDWQEGRIAINLGNLKEAESFLLKAQQGFLKLGVSYSAALVALDLAMVYSKQCRTLDLKRLAQELVPIFQSRDIHREAGAALLLFQQAVLAERATIGLLEELSSYLHQARENPRLRFERAGPPDSPTR